MTVAQMQQQISVLSRFVSVTSFSSKVPMFHVLFPATYSKALRLSACLPRSSGFQGKVPTMLTALDGDEERRLLGYDAVQLL
jgi:hypothetical protein